MSFNPITTKFTKETGPRRMLHCPSRKRPASTITLDQDDEETILLPHDQEVAQKKVKLGQRATGPSGSSHQNEVIELSDGEEVPVRFKYGTKFYPGLKRNAVLRFVKSQCVEIFLRRSQHARTDAQKNRLKKTADILIDLKRDNVVRLHREDWGKLLKDCVRCISKEVDHLRSLQDQLVWESQDEAFAVHILDPKELQLRHAEDDITKMAALIEFLEKN